MDTFTELITELKHRKIQYQYYLDNIFLCLSNHDNEKCNTKFSKLIKQLCPNGVEFVKLKDISKFRRGSFPQPYTNNDYYGGENDKPFVQIADISNNFNLNEKTKKTISKIAQKFSLFVPKGSLILSIQGSIGRVAITQYDSYIDRNIAMFYDYSKITKKFFLYALYKLFEEKEKNARGSTLKTITIAEIKDFMIPFPPIEIQNEIVNVLDQFNDLTNSLSSGLPKEIELRKQQYEYYRNKLLTFKQLEK